MTGTLQLMVKKYSKVFVVVDALDECSESTGARYGLLEVLKILPETVHLLVTSRPIASIGAELDPCVCLQIAAKDKDLSVYIHSQIQAERRLRAHVVADATLKDAIVSAITEKAQGM